MAIKRERKKKQAHKSFSIKLIKNRLGQRNAINMQEEAHCCFLINLLVESWMGKDTAEHEESRPQPLMAVHDRPLMDPAHACIPSQFTNTQSPLWISITGRNLGPCPHGDDFLCTSCRCCVCSGNAVEVFPTLHLPKPSVAAIFPVCHQRAF